MEEERYVDDVKQERSNLLLKILSLYCASKSKNNKFSNSSGEPRNITPNKEFHSFKYYWRENNMENLL